MAAALQVHDAVARDAIESRSGYVFATGHDRFSAVFSTPTDAVTAAVAAQQLLAEAVIPFGVRMGLHTGEAIERDGNYSGTDVNRAARLTSLAHGGQIVVSDTAEVLLRQRVALRPLGEHRLRGRMTVYQVIADGLRSEFPVLASADRFAGNLPQQLSPFVGREDLVTEIAQLLQTGRLVTLSGVGGVGKTRLALEVGAELAGEFPDGVCMIELAPASVPGPQSGLRSAPGRQRTRKAAHPEGSAPGGQRTRKAAHRKRAQRAGRPSNLSVIRRSRLVGRPVPRSRTATAATSSRGGGGGLLSA